MIEQKLFFTRNGQYTIWEKIDSLKEEQLDEVLEFLKTITTISTKYELELSNKKAIIYSSYDNNKNLRDIIEEKINVFFLSENINKCDFNGALFKINLSYTNVDLAYTQLQGLSRKNNDYDINGIQTYVYLKKDDEFIDIRLTSNKMNQYKGNFNEQIINTEVRIYFKYGLILMTDYNDYTHSKKVKDKLLNNIYSSLNDVYTSNKVCRLSDITLRVLLKKSKRYASKFRFEVDECINVDVNIIDNLGDNPLEHTGLRDFYNKHSISSIKIAMNMNDDKFITIDGEKGKISSRLKSLEERDINEFMELLNYVVKYDYLNFDYKKDIKNIAIRIFYGHTATKISIVNSIYKEIEQAIAKKIKDKNDVDTIALTRNILFYCLINKKLVTSKEEYNNELPNTVVNQLAKLLNISNDIINATFNHLMKIVICEYDMLEAFDEFVNSSGDLNVNQV